MKTLKKEEKEEGRRNIIVRNDKQNFAPSLFFSSQCLYWDGKKNRFSQPALPFEVNGFEWDHFQALEKGEHSTQAKKLL